MVQCLPSVFEVLDSVSSTTNQETMKKRDESERIISSYFTDRYMPTVYLVHNKSKTSNYNYSGKLKSEKNSLWCTLTTNPWDRI